MCAPRNDRGLGGVVTREVIERDFNGFALRQIA